MFSSALPQPRTTQVSGSSATTTGSPVSSISSRSMSRNSAPPPVSTMPRSAISAPSSGGVRSSALFTAETILFNGSVSASRISFDETVKLRGMPSARLRPLTSISLTSERRLADRAALDLSRAAGDADDDARGGAEEPGIEHFLDELLQHLLGHRKVGDHAVSHRPDGGDVVRRATEHLLGGEAHLLDDALAVRAAFLADRNDRGLIQYDALAAHVNQGIGRPQVDGEIAGEIALERFEHESLDRGAREQPGGCPDNRDMIT